MIVVCANWVVIVGRFYFQFSLSIMGSYNADPIREHIGAMIIIFGSLKHHMKLCIIFYTRFIDSQGQFDIYTNWLYLRPDYVEGMPPYMPDPKGSFV